MPARKYRSWAMLKTEQEESHIEVQVEKDKKSRFGFLRFISVADFEREAEEIGWKVGSKAPLILYGSMLIGFLVGVLMKAPLVMFCGAIGGPWLSWFYLNTRKQQFEDQSEEQVEILIEAVSSSYAITRNLTTAMDRATESLQDPLRSQWEMLMVEYKTGRSLEILLDELYEKIPVSEFKVFAAVLLVVEKAGGDASDTMKKVAEVIMSKRVLKEEDRVECTQQRQSHRMNVGIAILIVLFFRFVQAEQYNDLMKLPAGQVLIAAMFLYILWSFHKVNKMTKM